MSIPATTTDGLAFTTDLINAIPGNHLVLLPDSPTFTIAAVSDDYLSAINISRETVLGCSMFAVFFHDGRQQDIATLLRQSLTQVVQTKQTHLMADLRFEWPYTQTGGREWRDWRPVNKPVLGSGSELAYIIHTVEDITAELQLVAVAQANQYLQTIINLFKEPMQVLQPVVENGEIIDFRFKLTNQAYAAYANTTPDQLQGKRVGEVFPGYFETVSFTNSVETYKTGQPLTFEIHYDKDGLDLYNVMSTSSLDGEVVIHFTDFTRLRQLQGQLESKIAELNHTNDNLQQFAYIASHDLQEPLRKIQQFGDLLKSHYADQLGEGVDYLSRMQIAASRMSVLIRDLLAYSRISTQRDMSDSVSLREVLSKVLSDLDLVIEETGATIRVESLPSLPGDASQLGQLFQNLLSNALKFRRPDTAPAIQISASLVAADHLPSSVKPGRQALIYHRIDVADNGIGFNEKYLDRIFQVFQRLHGKNEIMGTGIGLAICQKVVTNHGGVITATSQVGQGATFSVYLPV